MSIKKNSVYIIIELCWNVFYKELNLINEITSFNSFCRWCFLCTFIPCFDTILYCAWLYLCYIKACSESAFWLIWIMEKIVKSSCWKTLMFLINFSQNYRCHADFSFQNSFICWFVILNFCTNSWSEFRWANKSHNIWIVL
jgi:hypothetical protein